MKIGIGNNITKEGKNNLKKYFKQKGYKYLDCDEFLKSSTKIYCEKQKLDNEVEKYLKYDKAVIDYTKLEYYGDYVNKCDYIINITSATTSGNLGVERSERFITYNCPKEKYYHLNINLKYDDWKKNIEEKINYNFKNDVVVTMVAPVYNTSKYLSKCINSLINQSYKKIEIILVDDGSTDNSPQICDEFAELDNRIKVIHKKNAGLSEARNSGIDAATGQYICFIDSDDFIEKTMVEDMLRQIISVNADVCECGFFIHNKDNTIIDYSLIIKNFKYLNKRYDLLNEYTTAGLTIASWNKMYKLSKIKKIKFKNDFFKEDTDYTFRLCDKELLFTQINKPLYHYIKRDSESLTARKFSERFFTLSTWGEEKAKYLIKKGKKYQDIADKILYNSYVHILKYYLRDYNKKLLKRNEYHKEILEIYNKLIKLLINTPNVQKYRDLNNIILLLNIFIDKKIISKKEIYKQKIHCIGVLWNSLNNNQKEEIISRIRQNGKIEEIINIDLKDKYEDFIKDIYVENHEAEGVSFIKYATLYNQFENNEITIINFEPEVSFYEFTNNTKGFQFINLAELKRNIRKDYKNRIRKYAFDNIFHLTMNKEEYDLTEKVLKKYVKEYKCIKYDKQ